MNSVIRAAAVYLFLLLLFRLAGNRSVAQITAFDFVLLLIISEAIQQALITDDYSITNAFLLVITLVGLDIMMSLWKQRSERIEKILDGVPILVIQDGKMHRKRMDKERVDESDILNSARAHHGLERLDQIKHAIVEASGGITIVPKQGAR
ncbi:MAG TPA: YetF domain-containing protein [Gemmatimonadaceae bacterium]|nr:YetF domain-containing protein [Gemmatimonadaceae bacterium]